MNLPSLQDPQRYTGLYVFDFGEQVAVGYTGPEIEMLLESEPYQKGKVYRVHRAMPDGTLELKGVPSTRFQMEDGMFFRRTTREAAEADFDGLKRLAEATPPPCRALVQLARIAGEVSSFVTAIIFPAEATDEIAGWLADADYRGGDTVDGGPSEVTVFVDAGPEFLDRIQLWPAKDLPVRSREEVYASTHRAVQR